MGIGKIISNIEYKFETDRIVNDALKYSKRCEKMRADSFHRRFASTKAGYTPPEYRKTSIFKKMFNSMKDFLHSFSED
ncbi:hypothetical protein IJX73_03610 [bacterium]|nr:hypothetical protein [bacterium]